MALTKAVDTIDATQEIAQNTIVEGNTKDATGWYSAGIFVWFAITNTTAHTGTRFVIQVSCNTSGDEDWVDLYEWISSTGTVNTEVITNNPLSAAGTSITVASTTGYTTNGTLLFLEDVSTFANSEWVFQTAYVTDTSITILDGVTREHAQNSILNNIAKTYLFPIPDYANRVRIVYDNTYDADGATVAIRASLAKLTGI